MVISQKVHSWYIHGIFDLDRLYKLPNRRPHWNMFSSFGTKLEEMGETGSDDYLNLSLDFAPDLLPR